MVIHKPAEGLLRRPPNVSYLPTLHCPRANVGCFGYTSKSIVFKGARYHPWHSDTIDTQLLTSPAQGEYFKTGSSRRRVKKGKQTIILSFLAQNQYKSITVSYLTLFRHHTDCFPVRLASFLFSTDIGLSHVTMLACHM